MLDIVTTWKEILHGLDLAGNEFTSDSNALKLMVKFGGSIIIENILGAMTEGIMALGILFATIQESIKAKNI